MSRLSSQKDGCFIVVKALPHRSSKHFETVCCAGVGRDLKWRRQYPVPYRLLEGDQKFRRWDWIDYEFTSPKNDPRWESQRVVPDSIKISAKVREAERETILNKIMRENLEEASARDESLALVRPEAIRMRAFRKTEKMLTKEREDHRRLAAQGSLFGPPVRPLNPCPFRFRLSWNEPGKQTRHHTCDDWETSTAFFRFQRSKGEQEAIREVSRVYQEFFEKGLALAFSTHSYRNKHYAKSDQWLLVGMIRLNRTDQGTLF